MIAVAIALLAVAVYKFGYSKGVKACMPRPRPRLADIEDVDRRQRLGLTLRKLGSLGSEDQRIGQPVPNRKVAGSSPAVATHGSRQPIPKLPERQP